MDLVIKIDDRKYKEIKEDTEKFRSKGEYVPYLYEVIEAGTPLHKGHGNLVDISQRVTVQFFDHEFEEFTAKTMTIEDCLSRSIDEDIEPVIKADEEETS